jgi:hypothetical protein
VSVSRLRTLVIRFLSPVLILGLAATSFLEGQTISGSIAGRVVDPQGAAVPNALVTATETSKNFSVNARTNGEGEFFLSQLQPGNYTLEITAPGFKKMTRPGVPLDANDKLGLGSLTMEVGAVSETVEVSAQAALLQTESAERSATIVGKQIENLEVNGRNPLDMAKLIPGVVDTSSFAVGGLGGLSGLQVNGNRGTMNSLTINGIGNIDTGSDGSQNISLSIDSMAEFKILTGMYQAEYGRNAGAQISMVTKSGSSEFHGSGYWYHRHDDLDANSWINNRNGLPRALFRYNDPGYTIGGPVFIPHLLHATKNRLFFFWSEEFQKQLSPTAPKNITVPTALERTGNFSATVDQNGNPVVIKDPNNNGAAFPGNIIPTNKLYAPGIALLNVFPAPNAPGFKGYNYTSQVSGNNPRREDLLRIDYNATQKLRIFGHEIQNTQPYVYVYGGFVLGETVPLTPINYPTPGHSYAIGATYVINPTMTNEFNLGLTHNSINIFANPNSPLSRTTSGINLPLLYPNALQNDYIPQASFNGSHLANGPSFGTADAPFVNYNTTIDITDGVTKIWHTHSIKFGIYMQRSRKNQTSFGDNNGNYNFGDTSANPLDTGYGYANAALGVYQSMDQASGYINGQYRYWNIEEYVQDTWKITPRITLDYGMRIAWYQPQYDASLQASTFVVSAWDPKQAPRLYAPKIVNGVRSAYDAATNTVLPAYDIGLEVPGTGNPFNGVEQAGKGVSRYLQQDRGPQWGPRFGAAWDVTGKQNVVLRAGGGIYYDRFQGNRVFDFVRNPPESVQPTLLYGFAQNINANNVLLSPPTLYAADPTAKIPTTYNYQFDIQTRLPWKMMLDTAYVGMLGRHLQDNRNLNYVPYGSTFAPQNQDPTLTTTSSTLLGSNALKDIFFRPFPGYNNINLYESNSTSNYNALQWNLSKRFGSGLSFGAAYTWSKVLTTASSDTTFVRADQYTRQADYGPASFDRRQVLAVNYIYSIPSLAGGNRLTHAATNGWQISGVVNALTGSPFTPGFSISGASSANETGSTTEPARIGVVKGCNPYTGSSDPYNRLNAACFFAPSPGSLGLESGQNWLYTPGLINFDMSLQKQFSLKERVKFQFRIDAFNVFNHANFTGLSTTLNFNGYPNPTIAKNATPYNAAGQLVNLTGFGAVNAVPGVGSLGGPRILQTVIRIQF